MSSEIHGEVVKEVGLFGLKTLLTLNAGASIVLLTFVGTTLDAETTRLPINYDVIEWAMMFFLGGIAAALVSVTSTYILAQLSGIGRASQMSAWRFLAWMIIPAVLSFLLFATGVLTALCAVG